MTLRLAFVVDSVPFSRAVRDGETSLGGSESSCLGVARALSNRGHAVHIFATQLAEDAEGQDADGCYWHRFEELSAYSALFHWDVFVGLRMPKVFNNPIRARLRILWNQDLMNVESFKATVMSVAWQIDTYAYVSDFHRKQWEEWMPELAPFGWATRNGFDPALIPSDVVKNPNTIIHISRPERGLAPLLEMWPTFKRAHPDAELQVCRYSSMYDAQGWGQVCAAFDEDIARIHAEVGGITFLGELDKPSLYHAISAAAVMWYPGVPGFAETSCIAAIEAQACGTPFVGSFKGALPETVPSGCLVRGDAFSPEYQRESMGHVSHVMAQCARKARWYRDLQQQGRAHVQVYTYDALAAEWEDYVEATFRTRYESNQLGVLRALMHEDDLMSARLVARDIVQDAARRLDAPRLAEADAALDLIARVASGEEHTAQNYGEHSMDPLAEIAYGGRIPGVVPEFKDCTHVLDIACGNGAFALSIAKAHPECRVTAIDFSPVNVAKATAAAETMGLSDRVTFICESAWDFPTQQPSAWLASQPDGTYDGLWVGEFIEHVADCTGFVDAVERVCVLGAKVVYTCPAGPLSELLPRNVPYQRSHVHHFTHADVLAVWGEKQHINFQYLTAETSPVGSIIGGWLISYRTSDAKAGDRPHAERILKTRPRLTLTVGILAHNSEYDLGRCLDALWFVADEILIADTGSVDGTIKVAESFERKVRVIQIPHVNEQPEGFAGARNMVLQEAQGDWFLWIDTDEILIGSQSLRPYLETGGPYVGFAIKQNHFQLDAPFHFDTPVRVFRTDRDIQFYGCVHEQPQRGDCNGDVFPALQLEEVQIAHFGYLVSGIRKKKAYQRNRPLLVKDLTAFPDRRLGKVLWLRQLAQDAEEIRNQFGPDDPRIRRLLGQAVGLFRQEFADPTDKYHAIARPFYEGALRGLNQGFEVELSMAGKRGGLGKERAKPSRVWVLDAEELNTVLQHQASKAIKELTPATVRVDPYVDAPARESVSA